MQPVTKRVVGLVALETVWIVMAVIVATYVRLGDGAWAVVGDYTGMLKALLLAGVAQTCLYYSDLYDLRLVADKRELFTRMLQALGAASFILAAVYFWFPDAIIGRGVFVIAAVFVLILVLGWRLAFDWVGSKMAPRERLLLVGTSAAAVTLAR